MKKLNLLLILIIIFVGFNSCSKDDDNKDSGLKYELNKLIYDGELYSLENLELRNNNYFRIGPDDYYCSPENPDLEKLYTFYFDFTDISNNNSTILPFLTLNLIIPNENIIDRRPLTIELNSTQDPCTSSSASFSEITENETKHYISVKGNAEIISIEQPFVKIKFEGEFNNGKKFNGYFEGYLL